MKRVYLTDDDEDDRMLIRSAIEQVVEDVEIVELNSGEHLLNVIEGYNLIPEPALILMDMNMPRMNGLETLARLKSNPIHQHIPVVMISTTSNNILVRQAYDLGVNAFLEKPILEQDFLRLAQAVDVCFLNADEAHAEVRTGTDEKQRSLIVIENDQEKLEDIKAAIQTNMPEVNVIEMSKTSDVIDNLGKAWGKINPAPNLILMDLYLPTRQEGLDLLIAIRSHLMSRKLLAIPLVVFNHSSDSENKDTSYQKRDTVTRRYNGARSNSNFRNLPNFWWNTVSYAR
jgi:CheY-like chemotaxis protein